MISVPPDGKKGITLAANANLEWSAADGAIACSAIASAPAGSVLVVDYEIAPFIVQSAIESARQRNLPVILDPSPTDRVEPTMFSQVTYIVPDAGEAKKLTGIAINSTDHAIEAARHLVDRGVENACVKLADGGCVLVNCDHVIHVPPVETDVIDTTGAGDAFAGGLAVAVLEGRSRFWCRLFCHCCRPSRCDKIWISACLPQQSRTEFAI